MKINLRIIQMILLIEKSNFDRFWRPHIKSKQKYNNLLIVCSILANNLDNFDKLM